MAGRVLTKVERGQDQSECGDASKDIGQAAGGDQSVAGPHERAMAQSQRRREFRGREEGIPGAHSAGSGALDLRRGVGPRRAETRRDVAQQRAIGFIGGADDLTQLVGGGRNRELRAERIDLARVQVSGRPSRHPGGLAGDLRRDVRIAVAIAADPGSEAQRRGVERQRLAERPIDLPQVARQRLPQRLLEHREAAADFIER